MFAVDDVTDDQVMWRALGDPTRRAILRALRDGPATSGSLAARFPMTRVAVTQHLNVLRDAGLITTEPRGRERWHHINAVGLVREMRSWLDPIAESLGTGLMNLKARLEEPVTEPDIDIAMEVEIGAPPDRVFEALSSQPGQWWGHPYLDPRTVGLELEATLGAPFTERWPVGGQVLATVSGIEPGTWLRLTGPFHLGLALAHADFTLSETASGTSLGLRFIAVGPLDKELAEQFHSGWTDLVTVRLKSFVETGIPTGIDAEEGA